MNEKKIYEAPALNVIQFTVEDIMGPSGGNVPTGGSGGGIETPNHKWE